MYATDVPFKNQEDTSIAQNDRLLTDNSKSLFESNKENINYVPTTPIGSESTATDTSKNNESSEEPIIGRKYNWTPGERQQIVAGMIGPTANLIRSSASAERVMPKYNKYRYDTYNQLAQNVVTPENNQLRSAYTAMDRSLRNGSVNNAANTANRIAAFNSMKGQIGMAERDAMLKNQQLANNAAENKYAIGAAEAQAEEAARMETNKNVVNKFNLMGAGMEQVGNLAGKVGEMMVKQENQNFEWGVMGKYIYKEFGLAGLQAVRSGQVSMEDLITYKGDLNAAKQAKLQREAQAKRDSANKAEKELEEEQKRIEGDDTGRGGTLTTTTQTQ